MKASTQEEIQLLEENGALTLASLPLGKRVLGIQWVYKTKYNSNGDIGHFQSRLVVFGTHQEPSVGYTKTFAPVAKMTTIHVFLLL